MTIRIDCAEALGDFCHMMNAATPTMTAIPRARNTQPPDQ